MRQFLPFSLLTDGDETILGERMNQKQIAGLSKLSSQHLLNSQTAKIKEKR